LSLESAGQSGKHSAVEVAGMFNVQASERWSVAAMSLCRRRPNALK